METAAAAAGGRRTAGGTLRRVLAEHRSFALLVFAYAGLVSVAAAAYGVPERLSLRLYSETLTLLTAAFLVAFILGHAVHAMVRVRPRRLVRHILDDLGGRWLTAERLAAALPVLLLLPVFLSAFTSFKTMIPEIQPFEWDATLAEWDRSLHGGRHPYEWLQPWLGVPVVTSALNVFYNLWLFVTYAVVLWQTLSRRDPVLRMRFLLSFVLAWAVLGSLAAAAFSSAGPCYYGRVTGLDDPFLPLMDYLRAADGVHPVWALAVQEMLWDGYARGGGGMGLGISAMPSMHVATSVLLALVGWRAHRLIGAALAVFAVVIMVGSVHLGWHYALDGYAGAAGAWLIWRSVGWGLERGARRRQRIRAAADKD